MKLYELAFTSHVYDSFTNFHTDFMKLCEDTKPSLDMYNPKHRQELINWLNQWGCRQFALAYHDHASQELLDWYEGNYARLFPEDKPLWALTESDLKVISELFTTLWKGLHLIKSSRMARCWPDSARQGLPRYCSL